MNITEVTAEGRASVQRSIPSQVSEWIEAQAVKGAAPKLHFVHDEYSIVYLAERLIADQHLGVGEFADRWRLYELVKKSGWLGEEAKRVKAVDPEAASVDGMGARFLKVARDADIAYQSPMSKVLSVAALSHPILNRLGKIMYDNLTGGTVDILSSDGKTITVSNDVLGEIWLGISSRLQYSLLSLTAARKRYQSNAVGIGLYLPHPDAQVGLVPLGAAPARLLGDRLLELLDVVHKMGASRIEVCERTKQSKSWSGEAAVGVKGVALEGLLSGMGRKVDDTTYEVTFEGTGGIPPKDLLASSIWCRDDPRLRLLLESRRGSNPIRTFAYSLDSVIESGFDAELSVMLTAMRGKASVRYKEIAETSVDLKIEF